MGVGHGARRQLLHPLLLMLLLGALLVERARAPRARLVLRGAAARDERMAPAMLMINGTASGTNSAAGNVARISRQQCRMAAVPSIFQLPSCTSNNASTGRAAARSR